MANFQKYPDSTLCWKRVTIPKGLPALLEILAKEVIRENPENIVLFLSNLLDELIAKREEEEGGSGGNVPEVKVEEKVEERTQLLSSETSKNASYTEDDERAESQKGKAVSGDSLKSEEKNKGEPLTLSSLTPLKTLEEAAAALPNDAPAKPEADKAVDEAIAAEIKTPLETIREESVDGSSLRGKTPESKLAIADDDSQAFRVAFSLPVESESFDKIDEISEEQEKQNLQEIRNSLEEEIIVVENVSLDDAKTDSLEMDESAEGLLAKDEESETDQEMMKQHVMEALREPSADLFEDDQLSGTASVGAQGTSVEIHESEVETMLEEKEMDREMDHEITTENVTLKNDQDHPSSPEKVNGEVSSVLEESSANNIDGHDHESTETEALKHLEERAPSKSCPPSPPPTEAEAGDNEASNHDENIGGSRDPAELSEQDPIAASSLEISMTGTEISENQSPELRSAEEVGNGESVQQSNEQKSEPLDEPNSDVSVEMSGQISFANSESVSVTTVRPMGEESSQDTSSLTESAPVPTPKPRKPTPAPKPEVIKTAKEDVDSTEASEPVLRRQKSSPKKQGKAVASKYRSGLVMNEEVSMEDMEAQIENEMMSDAATKIQAGFRGYKTRKTMRDSGVSGLRQSDPKRPKLEDSQEKGSSSPLNETQVQAQPDSSALPAESGHASSAIASASADMLTSFKDKEEKPSLAYLRSRSYPGSREEPEAAATEISEINPLVELDYDPAYMNNAATKIQASVRGYLVRKRNTKGRGVRQPSKSAPIVEFDVGDTAGSDSEGVSLPNPAEGGDESESGTDGRYLINPADRGVRESVSPASEAGSEIAATKIQAAFRGYKDRKQVRQTKKAVVTIQATVRGFLARRRLLRMRRRSLQQRRRSSAKTMTSPEILKMKKANDAATKIQAVYRGYQVRSKIRKIGSDNENSE